MAPDPIQDSATNPSWFTPKRLLIIFCGINLLNYLDRGAIASNGVNGNLADCTESGICTSGSGIQGDFKLNNFQDGILSSAFMVGLLVASPIFASLAKSCNPFRLIGVGLSIWTFAAAGCGSSFDFWSITICRMFVGVGEASFISLAAPFIDDHAPVAQKTAWLGIFYMCIPTGVALGYVYGGLVGSYLNWRYAFWGEAFLMLPFAIFGFIMKPLQLKGFISADAGKALTSFEALAMEDLRVANLNCCRLAGNDGNHCQVSDKSSRFKAVTKGWNKCFRSLEDVTQLLLDKVYLVNVSGYIAYNFVLGAYSYWGPKAGYSIYNMTNADMLFGGITIICGILGTVAGGVILDYMGSTISNAFKLLSVATFLGAIFCLSAFFLKSLYGFIALFMVGELFIFATQAPVNFVNLHCVQPSMRPLSMAVSTILIHILGDVPSSPLVGILQDHVNNWRETTLILTSILFLAAGLWSIGMFVNSVDRSNEDNEKVVSKDSITPLLEENKNVIPDHSGEA